MEESYFLPHAEHSSSKTLVCFSIEEKSNTGLFAVLFAAGGRLLSRRHLRLKVY
jgi:hypothetical protein